VKSDIKIVAHTRFGNTNISYTSAEPVKVAHVGNKKYHLTAVHYFQ